VFSKKYKEIVIKMPNEIKTNSLTMRSMTATGTMTKLTGRATIHTLTALSMMVNGKMPSGTDKPLIPVHSARLTLGILRTICIIHLKMPH
jgi:hypothetical protein